MEKIIVTIEWKGMTTESPAQSTRFEKILHNPIVFKVLIPIIIISSVILAIVNIPFIRWLQETDISLAWFAMLWVFVAWLQGYGAVWGISAMLDRNNDIRKKVPEVHKTTTLLYWIFLFLMIFMGVQLAVGTFRTYKNNSIQNTEIQSLITSDKQTELNNQQLTNEIDKLITQLQTTTPISSK